uniref:Fgenesh protein 97 n=1 Tax=Beta vulgaris TaxID=161934 RepID=Q1ZY12_BETVU|nr:Fgenesh protein 97 [Beta vulgaris]
MCTEIRPVYRKTELRFKRQLRLVYICGTRFEKDKKENCASHRAVHQAHVSVCGTMPCVWRILVHLTRVDEAAPNAPRTLTFIRNSFGMTIWTALPLVQTN